MRRIAIFALACFALLAGVATATTQVFFYGAGGGRQVRPSSLPLTADGTLEVYGVTWTSWGGPTAAGSGTASYHGCSPSCAAGKPHSAQVAIALSNVTTCKGRAYYAKVRLTEPTGKLLDGPYLGAVSYSPCSPPS